MAKQFLIVEHELYRIKENQKYADRDINQRNSDKLLHKALYPISHIVVQYNFLMSYLTIIIVIYFFPSNYRCI